MRKEEKEGIRKMLNDYYNSPNMGPKEVAANIIFDLFEMRAATLPPAQASQPERVFNLIQYNFFNVAISNLMDKYKISGRDMEEIARERSLRSLPGIG